MDDSSTPNAPEEDALGALAFTPVPFERVSERLDRAPAAGLHQSARHNGIGAAWDAAFAMGYADAFDRALERAMIGITTPRYYKGKQVGTRHRFDNRIAMAALNGSPPTPPQLRKNVAR